MKVLLLHAFAFGLYLLSEMVYYSAIILNVIFYKSKDGGFFEDFYRSSCLFMIFTNFMSQCLIIVIFWDLGKRRKPAAVAKQPEPKPRPVERKPTIELFPDIVVQETDSDFDMQAQIWSNFIRASQLEQAKDFMWETDRHTEDGDGWQSLPKQSGLPPNSAPQQQVLGLPTFLDDEDLNESFTNRSDDAGRLNYTSGNV